MDQPDREYCRRAALRATYAEIYEVADAASAAPGFGIAAAYSRRLWVAIDKLKDASAPTEDVTLAEHMSVALHHGLCALRAGRGQTIDPNGILSPLAAKWLRRLPMELGRL